MKSIQEITAQLAATTSTTIFNEDPEPYILTDDEAEAALHHEVKRAQDHQRWVYRSLPNDEVEFRIRQVNWEEMLEKVKADVLKKANSNKHSYLWRIDQDKQRRELEIKAREEMLARWDANTFFKLIKFNSFHAYGKTLIANEHTMQILKPLCYFLSNDPRFETELGYDLKKGIIFRGPVGLGKTHAIKCASNNEPWPILIESMIEITKKMKNEGTYEIPPHRGKIYIDDVGTEDSSIVNHYGTKVNWFKDFLEGFYLESQQYNRLILSTNIDAASFEFKYGVRVRSRIKDMFNSIKVTGEDLRGK